MFEVYILESSEGIWYYGFSEDLDQRVKDHNSKKGGMFTRVRSAKWELIFRRSFETKTEALIFEKKLKSLKNKEYIRREFKEYFCGR